MFDLSANQAMAIGVTLIGIIGCIGGILAMLDIKKRASLPAETDDVEHVGHTIIHTDEAGVTHTQRLGREHEVAGSETIIDVPVGTRIVIRHVV